MHCTRITVHNAFTMSRRDKKFKKAATTTQGNNSNRGGGIMERSFSAGTGASSGGGGHHQQQQETNPSREGNAGQQMNPAQPTTHMTHGVYRGGGWQPSQHVVGGTTPSAHHYNTGGGGGGRVDHRARSQQHHHNNRSAGAGGGSHQRHHQQQQQHNMPIPATQQLPPPPMFGAGYHQQPPPMVPQPYYYPQQQLSSNFQHQQQHQLLPMQPPPHPPLVPPTGGVLGGAAGANAAMDHSSSSHTAVNEQALVQQQEDIERGLLIDFYAEGDPTLLASWASFFRDRFLEVRHELTKATFDRNAETYRRATHFAERVESKILTSSAAKQLFRRYPLTPVNDPFFVDTCYRVIIDYSMRNPPFDGFTFGNPAWRDYMWYKAGLMKLVDDSRTKFLEWYAQKILDTFDVFIETEGASKASKTEKDLSKKLLPRGILEVCNTGMSKEASYTHAKRFYVFLFQEVLSELEPPQDTTTNTAGPPPRGGPTGDALSSPPSILIGKRVREVFGVGEEAFVLSVLRFHLQMAMLLPQQGEAKQQAFAGEPRPLPQDASAGRRGVTKTSSAAVAAATFSNILATTVEISRMLSAQEALFGFESPLIHFNAESMVVSSSSSPKTSKHQDGGGITDAAARTAAEQEDKMDEDTIPGGG